MKRTHCYVSRNKCIAAGDPFLRPRINSRFHLKSTPKAAVGVVNGVRNVINENGN